MKEQILMISFTLVFGLQNAAFASGDHQHEGLHHEDHEEGLDEDEHDHEEDHEKHDEHHEGSDDEHDPHEEHGEHRHKNEPTNEHGHDEEQSARIDDAMALEVGIEIAKATSQTLHQTIVTYGQLTTAPEQLSHVRARYSGLIQSVTHSIGDQVKEGDILAKIESNESLKTYSIKAPINGTVIQRHANKGEVTQDQVLFSIANFSTLWAELRIYPTQRSVSPGQIVHFYVNGHRVSAVIEHVIPALDKPYQIARVKIDNTVLGSAPGTFVEALVVVDEFSVNLAVEKAGLQTLGEEQGVFVKRGAEYKFTPLVIGKRDERYVEVLSGLLPGQRYVTKNSYLIKADIEKSEAEHEH
ncbi:MAG: efflux RND transporter periplasmic adaptor subunit [Pseudomonadales bacterium]|nr:efflux RND transporter periplasmic adaptor subunit [Pseudomonadales bacterium]